MTNIHRKRITRVTRRLRGVGGALLLSSALHRSSSRDAHYPFVQDSDLFYLTGSVADHIALLVFGDGRKPIVFGAPIEKLRLIWDGAPPDAKKLARSIGAEFIAAKDLKREIRSKITGVDRLYYSNISGSVAWCVAEEMLRTPSHARSKLPVTFAHADVILSEERLIKDAGEVRLIREAAKRSNAALTAVLPMIRPGIKESELAEHLRHQLALRECSLSFDSIIGSGVSGATLHYRALTRKLQRKDLLLIDFGGRYQMYCADITRVYPVSGVFGAKERALYEIVLEANKAAIAKARDGVLVKAVYDASVRVITEGLVDLGLLKGKISALIAKRAYQPFYPHSVGHPLGLDPHDSGDMRTNAGVRLRRGMVITIEPGIYLPKSKHRLPACGVRIEDDILITAGSADVLTSGCAKEIDEIEALLRR